MKTAEKYAEWIVANQAKKGTPEFETVARAYKAARAASAAAPSAAPEPAPAPKAAEPADWGREAALAGKAAFQGVASLPLGFADFQDLPRALASRVMGQPYQAPSERFNAALDNVTYSPKNRGERLTSDAIAGTTGAFVGGPARVMTGLAGGAGGLAAGGAREAGGGPMSQIIAALIASAGVGGATKVGKTLSEIVDSSLIPGGGKRAAVRATANIVGDKDAIAEALLRAKNGQTAAQAAAPTGSAEFAALEKIARENAPSKFQAVDDAQQASRAGRIREIAKTPEELAAAKAARGAEAERLYGEIKDRKVDPRSEAQIAASRVKAAEDRTAAVRDSDFVPVPGMPRVPGRHNPAVARPAAEEAELKQAVDLMRNSFGLEDKSLASLLDRPSMRDAIAAAQKSAREKGGYFPTKDGQRFTVENLQRMKQELDDMIKNPAISGVKATEAGEINATRGAFVDWLSSAVPEWRAARATFKEASKPINKMVVGAELEKALTGGTGKERALAFTNSVENATRIPELQRKSGTQRFGSIGEVLDEADMAKVKSVADEFRTDARVDELMSAGSPKVGSLYRGEMEKVSLPQMLTRPVMIMNALLRRAQGYGAQRTTDALSDYMSPENVSKFGEALRDYSKDDIRKLMIEAIMAGGKGGIAAERGNQ